MDHEEARRIVGEWLAERAAEREQVWFGRRAERARTRAELAARRRYGLEVRHQTKLARSTKSG